MGIVGNKKTSDSHHFEVNVVVCPWTVRWTGMQPADLAQDDRDQDSQTDPDAREPGTGGGWRERESPWISPPSARESTTTGAET